MREVARVGAHSLLAAGVRGHALATYQARVVHQALASRGRRAARLLHPALCSSEATP
jgi:hypothetical protein